MRQAHFFLSLHQRVVMMVKGKLFYSSFIMTEADKSGFKGGGGWIFFSGIEMMMDYSVWWLFQISCYPDTK